MAEREGLGAQKQHAAHDVGIEIRADARGMTLHQIPLELPNLIGADPRLGERTEARVQAVHARGSVTRNGQCLHCSARACDGKGRIFREHDAAPPACGGLERKQLERFANRLAPLTADARDTVETLTRTLVAKLLHEPSVRLRHDAGTPQGERNAAAVSDLFDLG